MTSSWRPILKDGLLGAEVPVIEAFACNISDAKNTGKLIQLLNTTFPERKLSHLKRVNSKKELGKLQALLTTNDETKLAQILVSLQENEIEVDQPFLVQVPAAIAKTKKQHLFACQLWPVTNFSTDYYLESVLDGTNFKPEEREEIER